MKKNYFAVMSACAVISACATGSGNNRNTLTFPLGNAINFPGSFTGQAYLSPMIAYDEVFN
jgi:hypothetical protein